MKRVQQDLAAKETVHLCPISTRSRHLVSSGRNQAFAPICLAEVVAW